MVHRGVWNATRYGVFRDVRQYVTMTSIGVPLPEAYRVGCTNVLVRNVRFVVSNSPGMQLVGHRWDARTCWCETCGSSSPIHLVCNWLATGGMHERAGAKRAVHQLALLPHRVHLVLPPAPRGPLHP
eukprot:1194000-Prorocentrum_minimum.AAC.1